MTMAAVRSTGGMRDGGRREPASAGRWAIVLAGGDGTRLRSMTRRIAGDDRPKQFCRLLGDRTMLEQARARALRVVPPERVLLVLTESHERFYRPLLTGAPGAKLVVQHGNRGTAPAILYALLHVATVDADARVVVLPSDHYVSDDAGFMRHVDAAFAHVDRSPELTILLGITPDRPEVQYGWIEPGDCLSESPPLYRVRRFWEKPDARVALAVWGRGALWNSFVIVGRASSLLARLERAAPSLHRAFAACTDALGTPAEAAAFRRLYAGVAPMDFSRGVLARDLRQLAVLPTAGIEWSDVGDPDRLRALALAHPAATRPTPAVG
jgi:mannose-1-phosphate guanylyltransferase